jgi:hypothetical protein
MTTVPMAQILKRDGAVPAASPQPRPAAAPATTEPGPQVVADAETLELEATRTDLSRGLPDDTALLRVVPAMVDGQQCFRLEGSFRRRPWATARADALRRQRRLGLVLADELDRVREDATLASRCSTMLKEWSSTKYELSRWLTELRGELGTRLRLVVWDDTDFGIPWELFWHRMGDTTAWLGTVVQVIRWTTVHDPERHNQFSADSGDYGGTGEILFYEDGTLVQSPAHRICPQPLPRPGYRQAPTMQDLLTTLGDGSQAYGAVYVRCHGTYHRQIDRAMLADVSLATFADQELTALRKSRALVFLNACNSARAVIDERLGDGANRNFAEVFLRHRAAAVLATMAEVPVAQSARIAQVIIEKGRADGIRPSEYLRDLRARYAGNLPTGTHQLTAIDHARIGAFLYISMVVCFGHPDAVFRLEQP